MENKFNDLMELVNKCKKNREHVPEELLRTRYRKSFSSLKEKIKSYGEEIFPLMMVSSLRFLPEDSIEDYLPAIEDAVEKAKEAGYPRKLGDALVKYCDIDLFYSYAIVVQYELEEKFYADYWINHTLVLGGKYYNQIIDMWYDPEFSVWKNNKTFGLFWPPTKEEYLVDLANRRADMFSSIGEKTAKGKMIVCQCA